MVPPAGFDPSASLRLVLEKTLEEDTRLFPQESGPGSLNKAIQKTSRLFRP